VSDDDTADLVVETVKLISRKWHPIIIQRLLESGPLGFNEVQERVEGVSAKVLTDSLDDLVEHDLVERRVVSETPLRVQYELTDHGRDLQEVMVALAEWGERNLEEEPDPLVLVVDNDPRIVSMHAGWLEEAYRVERAYSGEEAIRKLTEEVDVVLLDRHMPGISGDEVLARIDDMGMDVRVVMLTAVEPDFDIVEMPFDAYVEKPGAKEELHSVIQEVLAREEESERAQRLLALRAKEALLRAEKTGEELARSEEYARLQAERQRLEADVDADEEIDAQAIECMLTDGT
jgi:DNA-binding HxlR family transcriptional regulator